MCFIPCAEVLGVGSGSRLTRVTGSGVSVPFSVGSSLLVDDPEEAAATGLLVAELVPTLLLEEEALAFLTLPLPLTSL